MGEQAPAYVYLAFVFAYGTQVLHTPRDFLLTALITAGLVSFVTIPLAGHLSDRFGRKRIYLIGSVATGVFGFIYTWSHVLSESTKSAPIREMST
jgi:MFS family permease